MTEPTFPTHLDPFKWAEQGFNWQGKLALSRFSRLAQDALGDAEQQFLDVVCDLKMDNYHRFIWLDAKVQGSVILECQRCLGDMAFELDTTVHLAILNDESMIERLPDDVDFVVLGENDSSQKSDYFTNATADLLALIEDEILLVIPFSPKHEDCSHQYQPVESEQIVEKKENPFDILASLKKN